MFTISRLEVKNCLRIKEFQFNPGKINVIKGRNEVGKTSILEIIEKGLFNKQRRPEFITKGAESGEIYIELNGGAISIDRKMNADGKTSSIKVIKDGKTVSKPEAFLKDLVGGNTNCFNPVDFILKKDQEQTDILLSLVPMQITAEQLNEWYGEVPAVNLNRHGLIVLKDIENYYYDKRANANKEVKLTKDQIDALESQLPDNYDAKKWESISLKEKYDNISECEKINGFIDQANDLIKSKDTEISDIDNKYRVKIQDIKDIYSLKSLKVNEKYQEAVKSKGKDIETLKDAAVQQKSDIQNNIQELEKKIAEYKKEYSNVDVLTAEKIKSVNQEIESEKTILNTNVDSLNTQQQIKINDLDDTKQKEIQELNTRIESAKQYISANKPIEIQPLKDEATKIEYMKGYLQLYTSLQNLYDDFKKKNATAEKYNEFVDFTRKEPAKLLSQMKMPVDGLGVDDNMQVTINDLPIKNLSTSKKIRVSLAIAKATSGPLKLICVDQFEALDPINQEEFFKQAAGKDGEGDGYEYFVTTPSEDENLTIDKKVE